MTLLRNSLLLFTVFLILFFQSPEVVLEGVLAKFLQNLSSDELSFFDLIYSFIAYLPTQLGWILISMWVYIYAKKSTYSALYLVIIVLTNSWIGLVFFLTIYIKENFSFNKKEIFKISFLILIAWSFVTLNPLLLNFYIHKFDFTQRLFEINLTIHEQSFISMSSPVFNILISIIFIIPVFYKTLKKDQSNPIFWLVSTIVLGIIPWTIYNLLSIVNNNQKITYTPEEVLD
ncbi:hypothetical protein MY04_4821 [Flammeovirga sp. MY04]|uniref:hypothetical protein n=1 Tax=Flammeovirga sp. MY04 TaxID=1191459 RepID=UPI0008063B25|nr:hypothetical protein [Flammeovirga sp. MY04]ANQ52156.1 hypothetical protein MY04_4821 [Flammeovirga sp. MY04]